MEKKKKTGHLQGFKRQGRNQMKKKKKGITGSRERREQKGGGGGKELTD